MVNLYKNNKIKDYVEVFNNYNHQQALNNNGLKSYQ